MLDICVWMVVAMYIQRTCIHMGLGDIFTLYKWRESGKSSTSDIPSRHKHTYTHTQIYLVKCKLVEKL